MKTHPVQELKPSDYDKLIARVDAVLWELIFKPLVALVRPTLPATVRKDVAPAMRGETPRELHNAPGDALKKALRDGRVQMTRNAKTGEVQFIVAQPDRRVSDGLRAFGARLNKTTGNWTCAPEQVPLWVRDEARNYTERAREAHKDAEQLLMDLDAKLDAAVDASDLRGAAEHAAGEVAKGGWKDAAKGLEASWNLGPAGQDALQAALMRTRNIPIKSPGKVGMVDAFDLSTKQAIKIWGHEAISRLRDQVAVNAEQGYRAEGLASKIRNEYGTSKSRSALIARTETSNYMAAYRSARAADAGLRRYVWKSVRDTRTRKLHKEHHNQIYRYDQPPIIDERTGIRGNPGEIYNCRCVDAPIVE